MREPMRQICNLPALKYIPHYTYDDYSHWEGKWELIDGIPIAMSPAPIPKHQLVAGNLAQIFNNVLRAQCNKCKLYPTIDWLVKDDTVLQPDFLIACAAIKKKYLDFPPVLVVEILSPSTAIKDRNAKYQIYESQQVKYYLLIDVVAEKIEIYELVRDQYQPVAVTPDKFTFHLHHDCSMSISFKDLWD
jgi:Uma2 family endonuclease